MKFNVKSNLREFKKFRPLFFSSHTRQLSCVDKFYEHPVAKICSYLLYVNKEFNYVPISLRLTIYKKAFCEHKVNTLGTVLPTERFPLFSVTDG